RPIAIAFDGINMWTANEYVYGGTDIYSDSVTKISPTGTMTTYNGTGSNPDGVAFDGTNMWTANAGDNSVTKISPTGTMTTYTGTGNFPAAIAFDGTNMWTANEYGNGVTEISPTGTMTTYNGTGSNPDAIAFDGTNMWTANSADNSVTKIIATNATGASGSIVADGLLGQPNYTSNAIYGGQGSINSLGFGGVGYNGVTGQYVGGTLDPVNHRLFVADIGNFRVLVYQLDATNNITTTTPQYVLGACDFTSLGFGGVSSSSFQFPLLAYDSINNRLFVADGHTNRVLAFNVAPSSISDCEDATFVLGQPNFTIDPGGLGQNQLDGVDDIAYDPVNSRLFVSDMGNHRVMAFSVPGNATSSINGENAIFELGQPDFTSNGDNNSQNGLGSITGEAYDPVNSRLFVSDYEFNRIEAFSVPDNATSSINGESAIFDLCTGSTGQSKCQQPDNLDYDSTGNRLFVGDKGNNRVLIFNVPGNATSSIDGENAQNVIGQSSWGSNTPGLSQKKGNWLNSEHAYDPVNNRIYVGDVNNARMLSFSMIHITTPSFPAGTVGSVYSQQIAISQYQGTSQTYSVYSGTLPTGLSLDTSTGIISGTPTTVGSSTVTIEADDNFNTGPFFDRKIYNLAINSTDATLSNLILSQGTLSPTFSSGVASYTATVSSDVSSLTVTPITTDSNATVTVNGGSVSTPINLISGSNTLTILVTAQDGNTTNTYTIIVTRTIKTPTPPTPPAVIVFHGGHMPLPVTPTTNPIINSGCTGITGFSITTGQSCIGNSTSTATVSTVGQIFSTQAYHFTLTLRKDSKGNEVTELQNFLNAAGYNCGTADGIFGNKVKAAIIKFQIANGLKGDGVVGVKTRLKLK
ncbi:MAG: cadherin-like beta sandwich domain-containing protein, partial [Candidatus Pacebacteria bacterium]|nr:cadherin-like beta sandwich domain-containing protein [Candidatus Paceibacterota bacterium]